MELEGIILAAGLSSRAKTFKMTLEFKGKTVLENTIDSMLELCRRVIVVGGYRIEELQPIAARYDKVLLVHNEGYSQGMYSSVKKGMSFISTERFFLTPGDYPLINAAVYKQLLQHDAPVVIPAYEGKKGHPVLFDRDISRQVLQNEGFETLRDVIRKNHALVIDVDCPGILLDLDTIEDYEMLIKQADKVVNV